MRLLSRFRTQVAHLLLFWLLGAGALAAPPSLEEGVRLAREGRLSAACEVLARAGHEPRVLAARARFEAARLHHDQALRLAALVSGPSEVRFDAEVTAIGALYDRGRIHQAWDRLEALERQARQDLPADVSARFYLLRGRMWFGRDRGELARKNFAEVVRQADRPGAGPQAGDAAAQALAMWARELETDEPEQARLRMEEALRRVDCTLAALAVEEIRLILDAGQGRYQEAINSARLLASLQRALGESDLEARLLKNAAGLSVEAGEWESAERAYALATQRILQCRNPGLIRSLVRQRLNSLNMHRERAQAPVLEATFRQAFRILSEPEDRIWLLVLRSEMRAGQGRHDQAGFEEAWNLARKSGLPRLEAWALEVASLAEARAGRPEEACELTRRALALVAPLPASRPDDPTGLGVSRLQRSLAANLQSQARFAEVEAALRRAQADPQLEDWPEERIRNWQALLSLGLAASRLPLAREAMEGLNRDIPRLSGVLQRQALTSITLLPLVSSALWSGPQIYEDPLLPGSLESPGAVLLRQVARHPETIQNLLANARGWAEYESRRGSPAVRAVALLVQGLLLDSLGRQPEARDLYGRALESARTGGFQSIQVLGAFTLARLLAWEGDHEQALAVLLATRQDLAGTPLAKERSTLDRMVASLLLRMGRPQEALVQADLAVEEAGTERTARAAALSARAKAQFVLGRGPEAARQLEEAARLSEGTPRVEGIYRMFRARTLEAEEALAEGRRALKLLADSGALLEERQCALEQGERLEAAGRVEEALTLYEDAVESLLDWTVQIAEHPPLDEAGRRLFERAVALRLARGDQEGALTLLARSGSAEVAAALDVEVLGPGMDALRSRLQALQAELSQTSSARRRAEVAQELASTRQEFFASLNSLKTRDTDFDRLLSVRPGDLEALQSRLEPECLLLQYYPGSDALYVMALTRERYAVRRVGVDRRRLEELVGRYRESLQEPSRALDLEAGRLLYGFLIEPVRDLAEGRRALRLVPGGALWYLPFDALPRPQGGFLVQDWQTSTLASASVLNLLLARGRPEDLHVVGVGAPEGVDLPGTLAELKALQRAWPHARLLTGSQAGLRRVMEAANGADVLHLGTHGTVDAQDPNASGLHLADGTLRLADLYGLRLAPGSLAVLSACQTGLAGEVPGRDLASLAQGLATAGASTVVASLWSVDDAATAELFDEFYARLAGGSGRAEALRQARWTLLARPERAHPFYWAAFTLLGDPD